MWNLFGVFLQNIQCKHVGHMGISIGNCSFLFFSLTRPTQWMVVKTLPYSIFPLKTKHLNMCNLLELVAFISLNKKMEGFFFRFRPLGLLTVFRGIINAVWCLLCRRRWFTFSVFFAVATVAREADLSKLAPATILLFLWLGQKSSIWFFVVKMKDILQ